MIKSMSISTIIILSTIGSAGAWSRMDQWDMEDRIRDLEYQMQDQQIEYDNRMYDLEQQQRFNESYELCRRLGNCK